MFWRSWARTMYKMREVLLQIRSPKMKNKLRRLLIAYRDHLTEERTLKRNEYSLEDTCSQILSLIKDNDTWFDKGVGYACARLVDMYDKPTMAKAILKESGIDINKIDKYDKDILKTIV